MATEVINVYVDWNDDGDFGDAYEDISSYLLSIPLLKKGRRSDVDYDDPGKAQIVLDNSTGIFSPENVSSPLYGNIELNRRVKVTSTLESSPSSVKTLWSGLLQSIDLKPGKTSATGKAVLHAQGILGSFREGGVDLALQSSQRTDRLITSILDAESWPAGDREIDTGLSTIFRWGPDSSKSRLAVMRKIQDMENGGRLREGDDFEVVFDARDHIHNAPHNSAQATYGVDTLFVWNIERFETY